MPDFDPAGIPVAPEPSLLPAIERRLDLPANPERVWRALTEPAEIATWFGTTAELELRPGGTGWFGWEGMGRHAVRVEAVDPPHHLAWRWAREANTAIDDGPTTLVEWTLEPDPAGGTILLLRESGFHHDADRGGNVIGWLEELGDLIATLADPRRPWEAGVAKRPEVAATPARAWAAIADRINLETWWGPFEGLPAIEPGEKGWQLDDGGWTDDLFPKIRALAEGTAPGTTLPSA